MKTVPVFLAAMLASQAVCAQGGAFDPCVKSAKNPLDIYESSRCADQNAQRERDRQRRAEPGGPGVTPAPGAAPRILSPEELRRYLEQAAPKVDPRDARDAVYRQARLLWDQGNLPGWVAELTRAARMGHGGAMRELGDLYMSRLGTDLGLRARPGTTVVCLDKATRLGDPEARTRMQKSPFPVPSYGDPAPSLPPDQDCPQPTSRERYAIALRESKAADQVAELAQQGWAEAQLTLAARLASRNGSGGDDRAALHWYRKAAEQGLPFGAAELDELARRVVPEPPTPEEVADATRRDLRGHEHLNHGRGLAALHDFRVAAALGNAHAMYDLGAAYEKGQLGLRADLDAALVWYRRSGERGFDFAARQGEQLAAELARRAAAAAAERYHAEMRAQLAATKSPAPPPAPPPTLPPLPQRPAAPLAAPVPVAGGTGPFDDINFTAVAPPSSGWARVLETPEGALYIDRASVVRRGSYVMVWELSDLKAATPTGIGTMFRSRKRLAEYQCDGARRRTLGAYAYALGMGSGDTVAAVTTRGGWDVVQPHMFAATVMKAVC